MHVIKLHVISYNKFYRQIWDNIYSVEADLVLMSRFNLRIFIDSFLDKENTKIERKIYEKNNQKYKNIYDVRNRNIRKYRHTYRRE